MCTLDFNSLQPLLNLIKEIDNWNQLTKKNMTKCEVNLSANLANNFIGSYYSGSCQNSNYNIEIWLGYWCKHGYTISFYIEDNSFQNKLQTCLINNYGSCLIDKDIMRKSPWYSIQLPSAISSDSLDVKIASAEAKNIINNVLNII